MATGQDVLDAIAAEKTIASGLQVWADDLRAKLKAAIAAQTGALTQAQVDQIFADQTANNSAVSNAMIDNTPAALRKP